MSGVLIATPMLVALVGWAVGLLAYWIGRKLELRRATEIAATTGVIAAVIAFAPAFVLLAKSSTTTLIDMDPREGERRLSHYGLPSNTTSDFCYRHSALGISLLADFQMSEPDFLNWMKTQNWKAVPFNLTPDEYSIAVDGGAVGQTDSEVLPVREFDPWNDPWSSKRINRGYCYCWAKPDTPDNTTKIIFDRDTNRVYFEHSSY